MKGSEAIEVSFQLHSQPRVPTGAADAHMAQFTGRLPRVTQVLALAIQFQNMIAQGDAKDYADLARLGGVCRERVSQIMRLGYLAPDIQVELLYLPRTTTGRCPLTETGLRKIANLLSWTEQRQEWVRMKALYRLA